jgi:hypothetical protein
MKYRETLIMRSMRQCGGKRAAHEVQGKADYEILRRALGRYRRGMETLMRQVLQLPHHPAVMYLHVWMPGHNNRTFWSSTIEDEVEVLVKYYNLQSISLRNALYDGFKAGRVGFREGDVACNDVHPNYLYHRWVAFPLLDPCPTPPPPPSRGGGCCERVPFGRV